MSLNPGLALRNARAQIAISLAMPMMKSSSIGEGKTMKKQARNIAVGIALCLGGGLLAVNSISKSSSDSTETARSKDMQMATASADRFANNSSYCKAFFASQGVGSDGVSADFSVALGDAIQANGGDVKRTFANISEKCKDVV
jgi:hypothetical protein